MVILIPCHVVPVDDLFFTAPPLSSATIPDIPEATLTKVQESGSFYFTADSERGVYRSGSIRGTYVRMYMYVTCMSTWPYGDLISMLHVNKLCT